MKILLDENLTHAFRRLLAGHDVFTVDYMKWKGIGNGKLLQLAADAGFEVMITRDMGIEHQQNLKTLPCAVIVLKLPSNSERSARHAMALLLEAIDNVGRAPRTLIRIQSHN